MKQTIQNLLQDRGGNYILPFFWQHGETEEVLREYMGAIYDCGIGAVCVEARPHPDYVGPQWWHDMDIILDEARKREMKVWILDDAHFPTGFAAGKMTDAAPELCKQYINISQADVCGPMPQALLKVGEMAKYTPNPFAGGMASMFMRGAKVREFDDDKLIALNIGGDDYRNAADSEKGAGDVGESWQCRADVSAVCRQENYPLVVDQRGYGL